jgi:sugar phosphate isomerase/epimerase
VQSAIQLYTLRNLYEPLPEILERVGDTAFEGVEFAGFGDASPETVAATLAETELEPMAAHVGIEEFEDDLDATVEAYREVGCDHLVVPWLDPVNFESRDAVVETANRLQAIADELADRGVAFSYHNHDQEFQPVGERTALDVLAAETDQRVGLELDVGWALVGGRDPADLLATYADRVSLVHLKDVDVATEEPVELGDGDVDIDGMTQAARDAGATWLCYEHDHPDDPLDSLRHGGEVLAGLV